MKRTLLIALGVLLAGWVGVGDVEAQRARCAHRGSGGWGPGGRYGRLFDAKTVETVEAKVVKVDRVAPMKGMCEGVHLEVEVVGKTLSVHLGPAWYIDRQDAKIDVGDAVKITGSRVKVGKRSFLIAQTVRRGKQVLRLRDDKGFPVWAGWRARGGGGS